MADFKSIIDIEVNDESFKQFNAMFSQYMAKLQSQGGIWKDANAALARTQQVMSAMAVKATEVNHEMKSATDQQGKFGRELNNSNRGMHNLAQSTKNVARNILHATTSLLKWAGITSAIGGLFGLGGLFGIDRLALSAASRQRSAAGLGTTVGANEAFKIRFGGMVDPTSFSQAINTAQFDPAKRAMFMAMGIQNPQSMNPADLNVAALQSLRRLWQQHPGERNPMWMRALGFDQLVSFQDWRRIGTTPDFAYQMNQYQRDKRLLNVPQSTGLGWTHFAQNMSVSEEQFGNIFKGSLLKLAGPINQLVDAIVKATQRIMNSPLMKGAIDELSKGIQKFANYLTSPDFQDDLDDIMQGINAFAKSMGKLLGLTGFKTERQLFSEASQKYNDPRLYTMLLDILHKSREQGIAPGRFGPLGLDPSQMRRFGYHDGGYYIGNQRMGTYDIKSRDDQVAIAARMLSAYLKDYAGSTQKAEQAFMGRGSTGGIAPTGQQITIHNATGGSAAVTVNGVAHQ